MRALSQVLRVNALTSYTRLMNTTFYKMCKLTIKGSYRIVFCTIATLRIILVFVVCIACKTLPSTEVLLETPPNLLYTLAFFHVSCTIDMSK